MDEHLKNLLLIKNQVFITWLVYSSKTLNILLTFAAISHKPSHYMQDILVHSKICVIANKPTYNTFTATPDPYTQCHLPCSHMYPLE